MNPLIQSVQSLNQLKFTSILILLLLVYAIIDFHFHIKKRKGKKISISWDYKIRKPILSLKIDNSSFLTVALDKLDTNSLWNDLNKLEKESNGKYKNEINVFDKNIKIQKQILTKKDKVLIPSKLLKKYQKDEVILTQLKPLLKNNNKKED